MSDIVIAGASVCGASHQRSGRPNEDAWATRGQAVALADGHGSERCPLAHVGSQLAVASMLDALDALGEKRPMLEQLDRLPERVCSAWRAAVAAHADTGQTPWTDERVIEYGTTVIGAVVYSDWGLALQLGDGDILGFDGARVMMPVPADARLLGNETTSLGLPDAHLDIRLAAWFGPPPPLLLLATDGYGNSFADRAGLEAAVRDFYVMAKEDGGLQEIAPELPGWLSETSTLGSGDDVSLALVWSPG